MRRFPPVFLHDLFLLRPPRNGVADSPNVLRWNAFDAILPITGSPSDPVVAVISVGKIPGQMQLTRIFILGISVQIDNLSGGLTDEAFLPTWKKDESRQPVRESARFGHEKSHLVLTFDTP